MKWHVCLTLEQISDDNTRKVAEHIRLAEVQDSDEGLYLIELINDQELHDIVGGSLAFVRIVKEQEFERRAKEREQECE